MGETRKLAAILVADVVGYSRLAAVDEDRTLARLRGLRSDLIDPAITLLSVARQRRRRSQYHAGRMSSVELISRFFSVSVLSESLSDAFKTTDDNVVGRQLPGLDGSAILAAHLDGLSWPAVATI